MRPSNLIDRLHDFGTIGNVPNLITASSSNFSSVFALGNPGNFAMQHLVSGTGVFNPTVQNSSGLFVPPNTSFTIIANYETPNNQNVTLLNVNNINIFPFSIGILTPGKWKSDFNFFADESSFSGFGTPWLKYGSPNNPSNINSPQVSESYSYLVLQKSIAVIEDLTNGNNIVNGQTKSLQINNVVRLNKSKSRGKENGSSWVIQVRDSNNNYITAIQGSDYEIVSGNLSTDIIEIKVSQSKLYRVICSVSGYTSSNNIYGAGTGSINANTDTNFVQLDVATPLTQDIITFPKLNSLVVVQNQTSTNPQKGYTGSLISVSSSFDTSTGSYSIKDLTSGIITVVSLTENQWLQEFTTRTNISLQIKNKTNSQVIISKDGLGPHQNITLPEGDYLIQYITVSK